MANVLVRGLPDHVHEQLQQRAARSGQSLQQYLVHELTRLAGRPTLNELLDRIDKRGGGAVGLRQAAEDIAAERDAR